jgi:signal transduction histidine kinase
MKLNPESLRQKIIHGYLAVVILVSGFVLLSWSNLNTLQEMVTSGEIVTDLFDTTLEIRRFEKNYFLYKTAGDYEELLGYIEKAEELLGRKELYLFASPAEVSRLREELGEYSGLLKVDSVEAAPRGEILMEQEIRDKGKSIVTAAEKISRDRKVIKNEALQSAKEHLLIGIFLLLTAGSLGGLVFYNKAVKPLKVLEKHMVSISEGEFSLIEAKFKDRELISLKTAFNRMLLELQARQRHLVQSEKLASLGTLVFGVAHELNNPLSNISTSCQILKEEIEDEDLEFKKELLGQIESETERARDVVGSLLEFSRSKERKTFSLRRAVEETIRFLKAEVPAKIVIRYDIPEGLDLFADKQKMQQVFLNLIKNAVEAIEGEGEIRLSAAEEGGKVRIKVADTGEGMEKEALSKIFDPFYSRKRQKKGYGLGLFIVHNIVEEHDGSITVESEPGRGTVFTIILPAEEEA